MISIAQSLVAPASGYVKPLNEQHTEYPKFVHFEGRPSVIVHNTEEEMAATAGHPVEHALAETLVAPAPIPTLIGTNNEEAMLRTIAAEKGIHLDGRWRLAKIRKVIEAASS